MKFKNILLIFILMYSSISMSGVINKNPSHESFNDMFNYWKTEGVMLNSILKTSVTQVLKGTDDNFIMSALFILSKAGKTEEIKIEATEALSSFCYNYSIENEGVMFSKCVDGTLLTSVSTIINNFYKYKVSKLYWEAVAYSCLNYNYGNPTSYSKAIYTTALNDECGVQLSTESYVDQSLIVSNSTTKLNTGVPTGYEEKQKIIYAKDYVKTTPYRSLYGRNLNRIYGNCPSGYDEIGVNHFRLYKNGSRTKKHAKTGYCLKNPYVDVYPDLLVNCQTTSKLLKSVSPSRYEALCQNWVDSGLYSPTVFYKAIKASIMPNQSIKLKAHMYGGDAGHATKFADLKKYWGDVAGKSNAFWLTYKNMTVTGGGRSFDGHGFHTQVFIPSGIFGYYGSAPGDLKLNGASLGLTGNKVEFYANRGDFPSGLFASIMKKYPTAESKFKNMSYHYNYPELNIDTLKSSAGFNRYTKVYNFNNNIVYWLNNETDWLKANKYTCGSESMNVYNNQDLLYNYGVIGSYTYTQKEAIAANQTSPRAIKINVDYGETGIKPFAKQTTKTYNRCIAN